ncbi:hypothetical protein [Brevibacterium moorei]|uniref:hypothetical protein n=1 Tax=Brevibacterium moorei TaxID=2968457 RepID=UPI00211D0ED9|nr:hypothetical protein [Brevibacterium sp. 68QC2CO]MCQ9384450.1 hypothetical protein [Brevibacterium sp. 68QC2CO]
MATGKATAQRSFITTLTGGPVPVPDTWAKFSGGDVEADSSEVWEGGATYPEQLGGPPKTNDVELARPYRAQRDQPIIDKLVKLVGSATYTISRQPTDADFVKVGKPTTYPDALLKSIKIPESDASSGDVAEVTFTFAVPRSA